MKSALILVFVLANPSASTPWEDAGETDGVSVWARDVPNSKVREVRAETVIPVPPKRVWEVLADTERYIEFMPYLLEIRKVGEGPGFHYEYSRIDPPIVDMRDYAVKVTLKADPETGIYQRFWEQANDKAPPVPEDTVRVQTNRGSWTLEPTADGKTHVTYYLYTDPGGSIPAWATNRANKTSLPDLLNAVKKRSVNPSYKRD